MKSSDANKYSLISATDKPKDKPMIPAIATISFKRGATATLRGVAESTISIPPLIFLCVFYKHSRKGCWCLNTSGAFKCFACKVMGA